MAPLPNGPPFPDPDPDHGISRFNLVLWIFGVNLLALVFIILRLEEFLGKQAGEQEDGDDNV